MGRLGSTVSRSELEKRQQSGKHLSRAEKRRDRLYVPPEKHRSEPEKRQQVGKHLSQAEKRRDRFDCNRYLSSPEATHTERLRGTLGPLEALISLNSRHSLGGGPTLPAT